ncbi:ABC transporter substrate-binding protein [Chitinimonas sp. BJYL2]|uniref:substrate-binding periplasmic protein n=1 Tax=Chitinimonas sp. BJYL2 TaxID=2976696 RepID=UPI0022B2E493|nr:transporter substrate-binding domain-containing protein [Chitinimonas sp. BJYL2]
MRLLPLLACLLSTSAIAYAQSLCLDRPIHFAHYEFGLIYAEGKGGIDDDVQKELARRSGCAFKTTLQPRARTWFELESGSVDMAGSGVQTPARDAFAWFEHYVIEVNQVVIGPKVPAQVRNMDQFIATPALTIGGVRSFSYGSYYDRYVKLLDAQNRFYNAADSRMVYQMFDRGRFDIFITSQFLSQFYFRELKIPIAKRIENWDPGSGTPSGLVLSKKSFTPEQARGWQEMIRKMREDGTLRAILAKHLGKELGAQSIYVPPAK